MNKACEFCPHVKVDERMKKLYNRYARMTFNLDDCPIDDPKVDCMIRTLKVDWEDFKDFLKTNGITVD